MPGKKKTVQIIKTKKKKSGRSGRADSDLAFTQDGIHTERLIKAPNLSRRVEEHKLQYYGGLSTDGAGLMQHYFNIRNPTACIDGGGTATDWTNFASVFDVYRVIEWSITLFPRNNYNQGMGSRPIALVADFDSTGSVVATYADCTNYENLRVFALAQREYTYHVKLPMVSGSSGASTILEKGWCDIAQPISEGVVNIIGVNLAASTSNVIEFFIAFKVQYALRR